MFFDALIAILAGGAAIMGFICTSACDSWEGQKIWLTVSILSLILAGTMFYIIKGKGGDRA